MPKPRTILVCGGAGFIGAHMCKRLAREGVTPVTFDNLATGHRHAVKWGPLIEGDLLDGAAVKRVFTDFDIDGVMHFAARSIVSESMREPGLYFRNNVTGTLNLLDAMRDAGVDRLVFSSTAAVYGNPDYTPIDEAHPTRPINPYGWSKLMAERVIEEAARAHGLRAVCLRYFNAAGADSEGDIGECHEPETHLIPIILDVALGKRAGPVEIFGEDFDTPDGTCVRDYVHVEDLCDAHINALDLLDRDGGFHVLNVGTSVGYSVRQVLEACRSACDGAPPARGAPRRAGDPAVLVADASLAANLLGSAPHRGLPAIIGDALRWRR